MNIYEPHRASVNEMCTFHSEDYIKHLKMLVPHVYSDEVIDNAYDVL